MRYPSVPLITHDPFFSIHSPYDSLYAGNTVHWTGVDNELVGMIKLNGKVFRFMGKINPDEYCKFHEPPTMLQTHCEVNALSTIYKFSCEYGNLKISFTSPLVASDLVLMSTPVSYIEFEFFSKDGEKVDVEIYFDVSAKVCVNDKQQKIAFRRNTLDNINICQCFAKEQKMLENSGDDHRIEWGYLSIISDETWHSYCGLYTVRANFMHGIDIAENIDFTGVCKDNNPVVVCVSKCKNSNEFYRVLAIGYDDVKCIDYFGNKLDAYYKINRCSFEEVACKALKESEDVIKKCKLFETNLARQAQEMGGEDYKKILLLSYRQAVAAHKLALGSNGEALFFSKECFSNGCMSTVDVSYPSIPLFLIYNVELVKGMIRPILEYSLSGKWPYDFAPHDIGCYPLAHGQYYGMSLEFQMPVEECGNMLIIIASIALVEKDKAFASKYETLLKKWVEYLVKYGQDPENQLCTDDFAGHLAHNTNLSVKAIIGIACFSYLFDDEKYMKIAKIYAKSWQERAHAGECYALTFKDKQSWSLKYNMVWDDIFEFSLFSREIKEKEVDFYLKKSNKYGTALDSRNKYTKSDWLVWAACLTQDNDKFKKMIAPLVRFIEETPSRVPFADWYDTANAKQIGFQNRSVVGGHFMKILKEKILTE